LLAVLLVLYKAAQGEGGRGSERVGGRGTGLERQREDVRDI